MCLIIISSPAHDPIIGIRLNPIIALAFFDAGEILMLRKLPHDIW
jgi:hypothetical protein